MNDRPRSACGTSFVSAALLLAAAAAHSGQPAPTSAAAPTDSRQAAAAEQPEAASEPTLEATRSEASTSAESAVNGTGAAVARTGRQSSLDLAAPDIRTVMPAAELQEPLPTEDQQEQAEEGTTVQVKGPEDTPNVPGGFGALWWALRHPSQAWRIFTPVE